MMSTPPWSVNVGVVAVAFGFIFRVFGRFLGAWNLFFMSHRRG